MSESVKVAGSIGSPKSTLMSAEAALVVGGESVDSAGLGPVTSTSVTRTACQLLPSSNTEPSEAVTLAEYEVLPGTFEFM